MEYEVGDKIKFKRGFSLEYDYFGIIVGITDNVIKVISRGITYIIHPSNIIESIPEDSVSEPSTDRKLFVVAILESQQTKDYQTETAVNTRIVTAIDKETVAKSVQYELTELNDIESEQNSTVSYSIGEIVEVHEILDITPGTPNVYKAELIKVV